MTPRGTCVTPALFPTLLSAVWLSKDRRLAGEEGRKEGREGVKGTTFALDKPLWVLEYGSR